MHLDLISFTITEIRQETNLVKVFELQPESKIEYKAGQYLTFVVSDHGNEVRRSYSLASSPILNEPLTIGLKKIANGFFSRPMFDRAKPGDKILSAGPGGVFVLPENANEIETYFFFAAGTGIIPIYSLIKTLLHGGSKSRVVLIYSNHTMESTVFYHELNALQKQFKNRFEIVFLFSIHKDLSHARLHPELISEYIEKFSGNNYRNALYYICGPESYMRLCTFTLRGMNVPAIYIKKEIFHTNRPAWRNEPPDKRPHQVKILKGKQEFTINVFYPESILSAARNQQVSLPYSCETGRCGNCIAKCIEGQVWMSYNEVLTDNELAKGMILTCTGFPINGDVTIQIV